MALLRAHCDAQKKKNWFSHGNATRHQEVLVAAHAGQHVPRKISCTCSACLPAAESHVQASLQNLSRHDGAKSQESCTDRAERFEASQREWGRGNHPGTREQECMVQGFMQVRLRALHFCFSAAGLNILFLYPLKDGYLLARLPREAHERACICVMLMTPRLVGSEDEVSS